MPPERSDAAALSDMLQAAQTVARYLENKTRSDYEREELLRHAVERNLEIIGEAARRLSNSYRDAHAEVPWRPIMATRHILAHDYDEVDNDIIWRIVTVHVPELLVKLRDLIPPPPPDPEPDRESTEE
jgi:uncharacterized protein with HEPN domain